MSNENVKYKKFKKSRRQVRIRAKIKGTAKSPRLAVFRSNAYIYAQLINDEASKTLASVSEVELKGAKEKGEKGQVGRKVAIAKEIGKLMADKAKKLGIESIVFDRGGVKYHGRVKAVAEGAREGGLKF